MPWTARDAKSHTRKANTSERAARWSSIANRVLRETGDEARAIRTANAAMAGKPKKEKSRGKT